MVNGIRSSFVGRSRKIFAKCDRIVHAQRHEDLFFDIIFPLLSGHCRDDLTSGKKRSIGITPFCAEWIHRFDMSHLFDHFLTAKVTRPISEIALEGSEADAVTKQISYNSL